MAAAGLAGIIATTAPPTEVASPQAAAATMLLVAPLLGLLPYATLAAVVIVYFVGLIQPAEFRTIRRVRTMEFRWRWSRVSACWCSAR